MKKNFQVYLNNMVTTVPAEHYIIQEDRLALYNVVDEKTPCHAVFAKWDFFVIEEEKKKK